MFGSQMNSELQNICNNIERIFENSGWACTKCQTNNQTTTPSLCYLCNQPPTPPKRSRNCQQKPIRICSATFVPGRNHKRCSRCKAVWYINSAEQKKHWHLHKRSCKLLSTKELETINECTSGRTLFNEILTGMPKGNHKTAAQLRRLRDLFDSGEDTDDNQGDLDMNMQGRMRGLLFSQRDWGVQKLWACPGITQFLLHDWDAISVEQKLMMGCFPRGRPSDDYLEQYRHLYSTTQLRDLKKYDKMEDRNWGNSPGSYRFCWLGFNLLMASAMRTQRTMASPHDGTGTIRKENRALAFAISKRIMDLWCNPNVRRSCGDAMSPAVSFTRSFITDQDCFLCLRSDDAHSPWGQLWPSRVVSAALGEIADRGAATKYAAKILTDASQLLKQKLMDKKMAWGMEQACYYPHMAYDLAQALIDDRQDEEADKPKKKDPYSVLDGEKIPLLASQHLLNVACGGDNIQVKLLVWNFIAENQWTKLGWDYDIRAFFRSLVLRSKRRYAKIIDGKHQGTRKEYHVTIQTLPDVVLNMIYTYACNPNAINMYTEIKKWKDIPTPRQLQDKAAEETALKDYDTFLKNFSLASVHTNCDDVGGKASTAVVSIDTNGMNLAREKMSCLKIVMPRKVYNDWNISFGFEETNQREERFMKRRERDITQMKKCASSDDGKQWSWERDKFPALIDTMSKEECQVWVSTQREFWSNRNPKGLIKMEKNDFFTTEMIDEWGLPVLRGVMKKIVGCTKWKVGDHPSSTVYCHDGQDGGVSGEEEEVVEEEEEEEDFQYYSSSSDDDDKKEE